MTTQDRGFNLELSRRKLIVGAGIGAGAVAAASVIGTGLAEAAPASGNAEAAALDPVTTPPVAGLHLQFGADASAEMVVSWHTRQPVRNPRVVLGRLDGKLEQTVEAKPTVTPTESPAKSSTPTMLGSVGCRPTRLICTRRLCTRRRMMAPHRSSGRSTPRRVAARRSPSPALAIRARRHSAESLCQRLG